MLVTHGPAFERLDRVLAYVNQDGSLQHQHQQQKAAYAAAPLLRREEHWGSRELADNIRRARPALHLHGHIKDARGILPAFGHQPLVTQIIAQIICCC